MARLATVRALGLGAAIAALAQIALPTGAPLYDGVTPLEPYRYLMPQPGQVGTPGSYAADVVPVNGTIPDVTAGTTENPPQAQLIALKGVFVVPPGVTSVHVSITAVPPAAPPTTGTISGNVYRVAVTDPSGAELAISTSQRPTVAMRSAGTVADAAIYRFADGKWQPLDTVSNASLGIYQAQLSALGDFAVIDRAAGGISIASIVVAVTVALVIAAIAIWALRTWRRRASEAEAAARANSRQPPRRRRSGGGRAR